VLLSPPPEFKMTGEHQVKYGAYGNEQVVELVKTLCGKGVKLKEFATMGATLGGGACCCGGDGVAEGAELSHLVVVVAQRRGSD
jgi:hypothetical protein